MTRRLTQSSAHLVRGMTLIELMVVTVVGGIVLSIAFGMLIESRTASKKLSDQQFAVRYAHQALAQIDQIVAHAIHPANLPQIENRTVLVPGFSANRLVLVTLDRRGGTTLYRTEIATRSDGSGIQIEYEPIAETVGQSPAREYSETLGGTAPGSYRFKIQFGYASQVQPGQVPLFADQSASDQWPALIRVAVEGKPIVPEGRNPEDPDLPDPVYLETSIVPGLLAPSGSIAAAQAVLAPTEPVAAPTSPTQEAAQ